MATTKSTTFVVKKVKPGKTEGSRPFYMEVGKLILREGDKGVNGTLFLHHLDGQFAVFPAEKRDAAGEEHPE
jgi:hypothetical protein